MVKNFIGTLFVLMGAITLCCSVYVVKEECPPNEEYLLCGSACPANCSSPEGSTSCGDKCVEGCFCVESFLRSDSGICVPADQCGSGNTTICEENEEFLTCGSSCPATCGVPAPDICDQKCVMGCFCKAGFVRDELFGLCVSLENCTFEQCPNKDEVFDSCNASCQSTCLDPEPLCPKICTSGCVCLDGLLRDPKGSCVSVEHCPTNSTEIGLVKKYLDVINKILHLSSS